MRKFFALVLDTPVAIGDQGFSCFPECILQTNSIIIKRLSVQVMAQSGAGTIPSEISVCKLYGILDAENKGHDFIAGGLSNIVAGMLIHPAAPVDCNIYVAPLTRVQFDVIGCLKNPAAEIITVYAFIGVEYEILRDPNDALIM